MYIFHFSGTFFFFFFGSRQFTECLFHICLPASRISLLFWLPHNQPHSTSLKTARTMSFVLKYSMIWECCIQDHIQGLYLLVLVNRSFIQQITFPVLRHLAVRQRYMANKGEKQRQRRHPRAKSWRNPEDMWRLKKRSHHVSWFQAQRLRMQDHPRNNILRWKSMNPGRREAHWRWQSPEIPSVGTGYGAAAQAEAGLCGAADSVRTLPRLASPIPRCCAEDTPRWCTSCFRAVGSKGSSF